MKIADEIRKCVAFVGHEDNKGGKHLVGTCFFVYHTFHHIATTYHPTWCVTARHVIKRIEFLRKDSATPLAMFLRLNLSSGGTREIKIETTDWECHEDTAFDAAVTPFALDRWIYDHAAYPIEKCLTPELIESECIGIGTQLFFVGLFKKHSPESKNIPILRVGNIAAMPDVTVKTEMGLSSVYLVESRSIGGLSGSPVFTYKEPWVVNLGGETEIASPPTRNSLMGVTAC